MKYSSLVKAGVCQIELYKIYASGVELEQITDKSYKD